MGDCPDQHHAAVVGIYSWRMRSSSNNVPTTFMRLSAATVAVNRGMPVAVFDSVATAEAWLLAHVGGADELKIFTDGGDGNSE